MLLSLHPPLGHCSLSDSGTILFAFAKPVASKCMNSTRSLFPQSPSGQILELPSLLLLGWSSSTNRLMHKTSCDRSAVVVAGLICKQEHCERAQLMIQSCQTLSHHKQMTEACLLQSFIPDSRQIGLAIFLVKLRSMGMSLSCQALLQHLKYQFGVSVLKQ